MMTHQYLRVLLGGAVLYFVQDIDGGVVLSQRSSNEIEWNNAPNGSKVTI